MSESLRSEIVAVARAMRDEGLVVATQGNVSARDGGRILITPAGLDYDAMTPGDVVVLGQSCGLAPSSEWRVHAAIYAARPDVGAIVHTHSPHATRCATEGIGVVPIAPYADTATDELAGHAVRTLGEGDAVLLEKHGVVGVGPAPADALAVCEHVEAIAMRATP